MMNSKVSKQWFWDRNAMNELRVHGGGAVLERMSVSVGGLAKGEPVRGMTRLVGRDISIAVSWSQSSKMDEGGVNSVGDGFK